MGLAEREMIKDMAQFYKHKTMVSTKAGKNRGILKPSSSRLIKFCTVTSKSPPSPGNRRQQSGI